MKKSKKIIVSAAIILLLLILFVLYFNFFKTTSINSEKAIANFDQEDVEQSFVRLDYFIVNSNNHESGVAEALQYLQDEDKYKRFAAIYLLGNTGTWENKTDLAVALNDEDEMLKIIAASYLIGWREKEAIPVLIDALDNEEYLYFSEPPITAANFSTNQLPLFFEDNIERNKEDWEKWWAENKDTLEWDEQSKIYK